MTYSVKDYLAMIADDARTGAYVRALQQMVTPASVVLDLGAGFGFFAVLAATLGARHVYAIEPHDAIGLGPALARANGVDGRVTFLQGDSRQVTLPERANLLVEDVRGVMPLHGERIRLLVDARARLLTPDARLVALRDRIWASPARHAPQVERSLAVTGADVFGVDLRGLRPHVTDSAHRPDNVPADLLLPGALLGTLDLDTVTDPNFDGTARWAVRDPLVVDGFVVWFDAELDANERFSAAPGPAQTMHGSLYLPLREPVTVSADAELTLRFCAVQAAGDYTWVWECGATDSDGREVVRTKRQSTLAGLALTPARFAARSELHQPVLGLEGRRVRSAIQLAERPHTAADIAAALGADPALEFRSQTQAFEWLQRVLPWLESGSVEQL